MIVIQKKEIGREEGIKERERKRKKEKELSTPALHKERGGRPHLIFSRAQIKMNEIMSLTFQALSCTLVG